MHWLDVHSSAVQALASIVTLGVTTVLAVFTWRYVALTRSLVRSAQDQVAQADENIIEARLTAAQALALLAARLRLALETLNAALPEYGQVREFPQLTLADIAEAESLARQVGGGAAGLIFTVATHLRTVEAIMRDARATTRDEGWMASDNQVSAWKTAMDELPDHLRLLAACANQAVKETQAGFAASRERAKHRLGEAR